MMPRLVACFRWHSVETPPARYLAAAERIFRRCTGAGGRAVAWGAHSCSFEFEPDAFRTVLKTCLDLLSEANTHAVGLARRELVVDDNARAWGPALVVAEALAGEAAPGELLLDPEFPEVQLGLLASLGTISTRVGEQRVEGALLLPGTCPPDGYKVRQERGEEPPSPSRGPSSRGARAAKAILSSMAPPEKHRTAPGKPGAVSQSPGDAELQSRAVAAVASPVASDESERPSYLVKEDRPSVLEALRSGDPELMLERARELRAKNGQLLLAQRLESMAELARGQVELGLQGLADAVSASRVSGGPEQCQAALAYAVGLAQVGRREQALLETLRGLARARAAADAKGESACCQLVAQLAAAAGHPDVASTWRQAAASCEAGQQDERPKTS